MATKTPHWFCCQIISQSSSENVQYGQYAILLRPSSCIWFGREIHHCRFSHNWRWKSCRWSFFYSSVSGFEIIANLSIPGISEMKIIKRVQSVPLVHATRPLAKLQPISLIHYCYKILCLAQMLMKILRRFWTGTIELLRGPKVSHPFLMHFYVFRRDTLHLAYSLHKVPPSQ